ncbi:ribonuclease H-like domain-containing protein [candidate division FCPU426 bacterium]|nr:ribonuclease H-like domain-containing protein [candidate division FCPU426 bacterium]
MIQSTVYLDIETSYAGDITVVGIFSPARGIRQLVGQEVTPGNLLLSLEGTRMIKTYNGNRFDLPVIKRRLGLDLKALFTHEDIMHLCWENKLKGGLKAVERQLGIIRGETAEVDGMRAMALWSAWQEQGDRGALELLLRYNHDDVVNLAEVEKRILAGAEGRAKS